MHEIAATLTQIHFCGSKLANTKLKYRVTDNAVLGFGTNSTPQNQSEECPNFIGSS